jgi:uncharacterized membrane protein
MAITMQFKRQGLKLLVITALAVMSWLVYTYLIDQESIWIDEWFTIRSISQVTVSQAVAMVVDGENTPPAYFLLLRWWAGSNPNDLKRLRCFSALFATGSVLLAYLFGSVISGSAVGIVFALLTLCSPYVLWYAQEARNSSFAMFLALLLVSLFYLYAKRRRLLYLVAVAALQLIGLYTHYFFLFFIPAQCLYLLLRSTRGQLVRWLAAMVPVGVIFVLWIPRLLEQMAMNRANWLTTPTTYFPLQILGAFSSGIFYELNQSAAIMTTCLFGVLFIYGLFSMLCSRRRIQCVLRFDDENLLLLIFFFVPILSAYFISFAKPILYEGKRYLIVVLPLFHLIVARGVAMNRRRWTAVLLTVLLISFSAFFMQEIYTKIQKRYWKQASAIIEARSKPGDAIYSTDYTQGGVLSYYGTGYAKNVEISDFTLFKKHLRPYERLWYVAYVENTFEERTFNSNLRLIEARTLTNSAGYHIRIALYDCSML